MGKRGVKTCPKCGTGNGPRSFVCKNENCDHEFMPGKKKQAPPVAKGIGKGKKQCPECKQTCGPRSFTCPHCNYEFKPGAKPKATTDKPNKQKKFKKKLVQNWKDLKPGCIVKVIKGTGDYYLSKDNGEKVYMQDPGKYTVTNVDDNGLVVRGKHGQSYIYMGESMPSKILKSVNKQAPKLVLLRDVESN